MEQVNEQIIAATNWSEHDEINASLRLILRVWKHPDGKIHTVAVHFQNGQDKGTFSGTYHPRVESGLAAFLARMEEHNRNFRSGNVSHLPGIAFVKYDQNYHGEQK